MSCGVGCRCSWDPTLLWLWRRLEATALIGPLAWDPPYAAETAQEMAKRRKKKKRKLQTSISHKHRHNVLNKILANQIQTRGIYPNYTKVIQQLKINY